ncbi:hypothetical protein HT031_005105 [Scenedesmus sp. PABB004]|nr:hypothetical protein HT031_005105 [Scenedesmus sp. PABB004]
MAAAAAPADGWAPLLALPTDLLARRVVAGCLSPDDRRALRSASRFPHLQHLSVVSTAGAAADGGALERQHVQLLTQLPHLGSLCYAGPADRRQPGLDLTRALAALAGGDACAPPAPGSPQPGAAATQQQQQQQQLTQLELAAGRLPDSLLDVVGRLAGLRALRLTATTALATAPLGCLAGLTSVALTVTPPLAGALAPLAALRRLAALRLAAISPARGWGAALALLSGCPLRELELVFADVCDADLAGVAQLAALTRLDLHCSRHLTPACVPHLARLTQLRELQLAHTGLQLGPAELECLGAACRQLTQLHAELSLAGAAQSGETEPRAAALDTGLLELLWALPADAGRAAVPPPAPGAWPPLAHVGVTNSCSVANLARLLAGARGLERLELEGLGPNGSAVADVLAGAAAGQLTALRLAGCSSMAAAACERLGGALRPRLRRLSLADARLPPQQLLALLRGLAGCDSRGATVPESAAAAPGLTRLWLERCAGVDAAALGQGVASLAQLRELELVGCCLDGGGGEAVLLALAAALPRLEALSVRGCAGVGPALHAAGRQAATVAAGAVARRRRTAPLRVRGRAVTGKVEKGMVLPFVG